jgi:L-threonylcarbamoyladenylate synthase
MNMSSSIATALRHLAQGEVVAIPTDTLYGLAADALNPAAVQRVFEVKGRPADMPLPVLVSDWEQVAMVADASPDAARLARNLADRFWPGSLTLVLTAVSGLPRRLTAGRDTIAVRMPAHQVPLALSRGLGRPITGTSANRSGQADITDPNELRRHLGEIVADVITCGPPPQGTASTIVAVSDAGVSLIRQGALPFDEIVRSAGSVR